MIVRSLWQFALLMVAAAGCWCLIGFFGHLLAGVVWAAVNAIGFVWTALVG